jgi:hypothetical protein
MPNATKLALARAFRVFLFVIAMSPCGWIEY